MPNEPAVKIVAPQPEFDLQQFLNIYGEVRIEQDLVEKVGEKWEQWKDAIVARHVIDAETPKLRGSLLLYLDEDVEREVDEVWNDTPTEGHALHSLAVALLMSAAGSLVPELCEGHCAPVPKPNAAMRSVLEELGLAWNPEEGTLNRKFAVLTPAPYRGGCEICFLSHKCPKALYG
jgi:hypothetical protein